MRFLIALLLVSFTAGPLRVSADSGPTLEVTTAWLAENLPDHFTDYDDIGSVRIQATYKFTGCSFSMHTEDYSKYDLHGDTAASGHVLYTIEMRAINGHKFGHSSHQDSSVNVSPIVSNGDVDLKDVQYDSIADRRVLVGDKTDNFFVMTGLGVYPKVVSITTNSEMLSNKLVKALKHAATLCGVKAVTF